MPIYAWFNSQALQPSPVLGYYNTDLFSYPTLPPSQDLLIISPSQWTSVQQNLNGWAVENSQLVPYEPPTNQTLSQQASEILGQETINLISTTYPMMNGYYTINPYYISMINSELISLLLTNTFTNGSTTIGWFDLSNAQHVMDQTQFIFFGRGIGGWYNNLMFIVQTNSGTIPASPYNIG